MSLSGFVKVTKPRIQPEPDEGFADFNVCSWNANGLRARIRKKELGFLLNKDGTARYDVVCVQETKADEDQVEPQPRDSSKTLEAKLPAFIMAAYPYRFYNSTRMRRGLNGTAVWSRIMPVRELDPPITDVEGRVTAVEFPSFIAVAVYVPNSGTKHTYRTGLWHAVHTRYLAYLQKLKPTVVCLDSNVCLLDIDIHAPKKYRDNIAGFLNVEREQFRSYLALGYHDSFRAVYPLRKGAYTWFNQRTPKHLPTMRERNLGWRLDHVLVGGVGGAEHAKQVVVQSEIRTDVYGSDHLPISSVLRFPTGIAAIDPASHFSTCWLQPFMGFLDAISAKCKITALSMETAARFWSTKETTETAETAEGEDKMVKALFTFAQSNLESGGSSAKQEETKHYFKHGEFSNAKKKPRIDIDIDQEEQGAVHGTAQDTSHGQSAGHGQQAPEPEIETIEIDDDEM